MPTPKSEKTGRPALRAVDEDNKVKEFLRKIRAQKQECDDRNMQLAGIYKQAEDADLNRKVLKDVEKLTRQDVHKSTAYLKDLVLYLELAGFLADGSQLVFAQGDLESVKPAA